MTEHAPLRPEQWTQLENLLHTLSHEQRLWVSGYLAGLGNAAPGAVSVTPAQGPRILVLYASQTGTAEKLARALAERLQAAGFDVNLLSALDHRKARFKDAAALLLLASTHGEGDPPDSAAEFYQQLMGKRPPRVAHLKYSVLALGDTSYAQFCKVGRDLDTRLETLGAERLVARADCDLDYEDTADQWMDQVLAQAAEALAPAAGAAPAISAAPAPMVNQYSRRQPFTAEVLASQRLSGRGADKVVRHVELSLEDSGIEFAPGDSIGIVPTNPAPLVDDILATCALSGDETVSLGERELALREALLHELEIAPLTRPVVQAYAALGEVAPLQAMLAPERSADLGAWLYGRDLLDLLRAHPLPGIDAAALAGLLRRLPARLYSVASSQAANPDEVHLTVAELRYAAHGRERVGVASTWLADRIEPGDRVPIYVHENPNFRLPPDPDTPLIMIGPGTGVAPFRAFVEEREARGARGRSWLFFGARHFVTDFLYQREWQGHLASGALTRMDVAFSRDQRHRIHVQQRLREHAAELYAWLEDGACIYVCGDAEHMAPDVHQALIEIIAGAGGLSPEAAADYLGHMQQDRRYQRDVY